MATKEKILKKKLIKEGIIALVVLAALAGGGWLTSNYDDDAIAEKQTKGNENSAMQSEHSSIQQQLGSGFEVNTFYDAYTKNHSEDLVLKRETATQLMTALRETNHLTNLTLTILPITDATLENVPLRSGKAVKGDVQVTFGSVTDNSAYGFIESLQRRLPGIVLIHDIKLTRNNDLSRDVLLALSQHRIMPLVTADISFTWLGIRPTEEDKNASSPSANGTGNAAR